MSEMDKRQELSRESAAMLAAMGVQVWHARGSSFSQEVRQEIRQDEPVAEASTSSANQALMLKVDNPPEATPSPMSKPPPAIEPQTSSKSQSAGESEPEAKHPPAAKIDRVEFTWVKGRSGMVLCQLNPDAAALQLIRDIVVFGDWVREQGEASSLSKGDFQWPQLLDTGGTPARALAVFIDKHWPQQSAWIAVTSEVQSSVTPWFANTSVHVIELPAIGQSVRDAALKKTIWQNLKDNV